MKESTNRVVKEVSRVQSSRSDLGISGLENIWARRNCHAKGTLAKERQMLISNSERASTDVKLNLPIGFEKGQVFTPRFLASWVADLLNENLGSLWSGNLLDPACGDGELLEAALEQMPNAKLFGTDIDSEASDAAQVRLGHLADIKTADMLLMRSLESSQNLPKVDAIVANPPWGADLFHSASDLKGLGIFLGKRPV